MAVVQSKERIDERSSTFAKDGNSHTRTWWVQLDTVGAGPAEALLQATGSNGIAFIGAGHPSDATTRCDSIDASPISGGTDTGKDFIIRATYRKQVRDTDDSGSEGAPETEDGTPTIRFYAQQETRFVERCAPRKNIPGAVGRAIVNSAGQKFVPPPEAEFSTIAFEINATVAFDKFTPALMKGWNDVVNDAIFFGFAPGTVKTQMQGNSTIKINGNTRKVVWELSLLFLVRSSWELEVLDQGTLKATNAGDVDIVESDGGTQITVRSREQIVDANGLPINVPVPLNGKGMPLLNGNLHYIKFKIYQEDNLNNLMEALKLPTNIQALLGA